MLGVLKIFCCLSPIDLKGINHLNAFENLPLGAYLHGYICRLSLHSESSTSVLKWGAVRRKLDHVFYSQSIYHFAP